MSRQHRRATANTRRRGKKHVEPKFYPGLARFDGFCDVCSTSFKLGDRIYWCAKTPTSRTCRCHELCYLKKMGTLGPSW